MQSESGDDFGLEALARVEMWSLDCTARRPSPKRNSIISAYGIGSDMNALSSSLSLSPLSLVLFQRYKDCLRHVLGSFDKFWATFPSPHTRLSSIERAAVLALSNAILIAAQVNKACSSVKWANPKGTIFARSNSNCCHCSKVCVSERYYIGTICLQTSKYLHPCNSDLALQRLPERYSQTSHGIHHHISVVQP